MNLLGCHRAGRILEKSALKWPFAIQNLIGQSKIAIEFADRVRFQPGEKSEYFLELLEVLTFPRILLMLRHDAIHLTLLSVLPSRTRIKLGLCVNHLFVLQSHG